MRWKERKRKNTLDTIHLYSGHHVILKVIFLKRDAHHKFFPCSGSGFYGVTKINVNMQKKIYLSFSFMLCIDWGRLPTGTSRALQSAPARVRRGSEGLSESPRRSRRREAGRRRRRPRCKFSQSCRPIIITAFIHIIMAIFYYQTVPQENGSIVRSRPSLNAIKTAGEITAHHYVLSTAAPPSTSDR